MASYVPLPGSKRTLLPNSRPAGPVDRSEMASITVRVRSAGDPAALERQVYEQSQKPLQDRTYLSREELAKTNGASAADLDQIEQFAQRHNLMVVHRSAAERSIVLSGKLGDLLNAFPADVEIYHHSSGSYRGRRGEISIPVELQGVITGIFGYDTRPKHRAPRRRRILTSDAGPGGNQGVAATEFAKRYNFPTTFSRSARRRNRPDDRDHRAWRRVQVKRPRRLFQGD